MAPRFLVDDMRFAHTQWTEPGWLPSRLVWCAHDVPSAVARVAHSEGQVLLQLRGAHGFAEWARRPQRGPYLQLCEWRIAEGCMRALQAGALSLPDVFVCVPGAGDVLHAEAWRASVQGEGLDFPLHVAHPSVAGIVRGLLAPPLRSGAAGAARLLESGERPASALSWEIEEMASRVTPFAELLVQLCPTGCPQELKAALEAAAPERYED